MSDGAKERGLRILATGGVLWRTSARGELALVHRHRYDDWCLPKGKVDPGETLVECALREVAEETGYRSSWLGWAGELVYPAFGHEKSVVYFELVATDSHPSQPIDASEVGAIEWLDGPSALDRMTYEGERRILRSLIAGQSSSAMTKPNE